MLFEGKAGMAMSQPQGQPAYALQISEEEVARYRLMAAHALARESRLLQRAGVVAGARIVDVGCGPGVVLAELARIAGPSGEVVGVEPDAASRAIAARTIAEGRLDNARVVDARGDATGLPEGQWDVVMVRHVLYHAGADAAAIVRHAAELVRPGGHVYLVDTCGSGIFVYPPLPEVRDQVARYHEFQRSRGNDPDIGLSLHALLDAAGLVLSEHEAYINVVPGSAMSSGGPLVAAQRAMLAAGAITEAEAQRFAEVRTRVGADPLSRLYSPLFVAIGRRPD